MSFKQHFPKEFKAWNFLPENYSPFNVTDIESSAIGAFPCAK